MTRQFLSEIVQATAHVSGVTAKRVASKLLEGIQTEILTYGRFTLPGFGTFTLTETLARTRFNPRTGEPVKVEAGATIRFKTAPVMKTAALSAVQKTSRKTKKRTQKQKPPSESWLDPARSITAISPAKEIGMSDPRFALVGEELGLDPLVVQQAFKYSESLLRHPVSLMQTYARWLVGRSEKTSDLAALETEAATVIRNVRQKLAKLEVEGALTDLEQAIKSGPETGVLAALLNERAFIERRTHQNKAAAKTLQQVVALNPTDLGAWFDLGLALSGASRSKRSAQPALESGLAEAKRRLEEKPGDIDLLLWLAEFHSAIGNMKSQYAALTHYRDALAELVPFDGAHLESHSEWNGALAYAHYDIGKCLVARNKLKAAVESFTAAKTIVERASKHGQRLDMEGDLYSNLGECLGYLGQYTEAVALLERGLALELAHGAEDDDLEKQIRAVRFHSKLAETLAKAAMFPEALARYTLVSRESGTASR